MPKAIIFRIVVFMLIILLVFLLATGIIYSTKINQQALENFNTNENAKYHVMLIVDGLNPAYSEDFKKGMLEASEEYKVAVELWEIRENNVMEESLKKFDIAIKSKVDGIIIHSFNNSLFENYINLASEYDIPVITLNEDLPQSNRISYIGINEYQIGLKAGELINKAISTEANIAVIQKRTYAGNNTNTLKKENDLVVMGLSDAIKDYDNLNLSVIKYTNEGRLSAEDVTMDILENHKGVNVIFSADAQDTLGVMQVLADFNRSADTIIIGCGDSQEILEYIERGVIYGSIVSDYRNMGYTAIKEFAHYKNEKMISSYTSLDIKIVDKNNIKEYKNSIGMSEENETK